jgi:uncharacterized protein DUF6600
MKRLLFAFAIIALAGSALPRAQAADVSFDFFYNNLSGGSWIEVADYGYCWQPDVAVSSSAWRPYADGYWVYSDVGWTWVSYEDFGWATYHYGRWVRLSDRGWVWVVGRDSELEWGPAWVSWRTGGDRIGWAPLPPRGRVVYERRPIMGRVDIEFDIGPAYYNFVDVRYIGEPVLRERIYDSSQNVTYINETVNVTNITYQNNVVYNYGPDYDAVVARSSRPIPRLTIEREANVEPLAAARSGALVKVEGQKLIVAAPPAIKPGPKAAPPVIKEKIAQPKVDKGWSVVSDPKQQEELKKKMQSEDPTKIPTPGASASAAAQAGDATSPSPAASASATASVSAAKSPSPAASASPALSASASPAGKGKKAQAGVSASPGASASPALSASPAAKSTKGKPGEKVQPGASPTRSPSAKASPAASPVLGKPGKAKRGESIAPTTSPVRSASGAPTSTPTSGKGKGKGKDQLEPGGPGTTPAPGGASPAADAQGKGKKVKQLEPAATPSGGSSAQPLGHAGGKNKGQSLDQAGGPPPEGAQGGRQKVHTETAPSSNAPAGASPSAADSGKGKKESGKKDDKKAEGPAASPTP